jgi:hypothetical protein
MIHIYESRVANFVIFRLREVYPGTLSARYSFSRKFDQNFSITISRYRPDVKKTILDRLTVDDYFLSAVYRVYLHNELRRARAAHKSYTFYKHAASSLIGIY